MEAGTVALSSLDGEAKTRLDDLALLCSNCHRMVHVRRPWLSMAELKQIVGRVDGSRADGGQSDALANSQV